MAAIRYRRNRRRWMVDWREGGVRQTHTFTTRETAQEFRRMKEESLERRKADLQSIEPLSFAEYAELFLTNHFKEKSGFASRNPVEGVERPRNVPRTEQQPWSDEDFLFVMRKAPEDIRRAVLILYSTGMRRGELFQLEKSDFDLMNG